MNIELEEISDFYDKVRNKSKLTSKEFQTMLQYRRELGLAAADPEIKGRGKQAVTVLQSKLDKVYTKLDVKSEIKGKGPLFAKVN